MVPGRFLKENLTLQFWRILLAAFTLLAVGLLCAQAPAPATQPQIPVFKTNAHAVEVDVVVTRENGEPVTASTKATSR